MHYEIPKKPCHVALELTHDEADALLNLLLCAPETAEVSEEMTSHLLLRLVEAQRAPQRAHAVELSHDEPLP